MKIFIIGLLLILSSAKELVVTQAFTDYLKHHVDWEVVDYEDNVFKGWTKEEVKRILGDEDTSGVKLEKAFEIKDVPLPPSVDNRRSSCTHAIRNQGNCGACWAFATSSLISDACCFEGKKSGNAEWMSVQELISCDKTDSGCTGGLAIRALLYVMNNGLVPEKCFPYTSTDTTPCPTQCADGSAFSDAHICKPTLLANCSGLTYMKACLFYLNVIAVRMVVYSDFMSYKSGIYCHASGDMLGGHAVRAVGYGTDPKDYLICANSWGTEWGEQGYFKIEATESCGLRMTANDAWTVKGF